jgi:hypothetical protein
MRVARKLRKMERRGDSSDDMECVEWRPRRGRSRSGDRDGRRGRSGSRSRSGGRRGRSGSRSRSGDRKGRDGPQLPPPDVLFNDFRDDERGMSFGAMMGMMEKIDPNFNEEEQKSDVRKHFKMGD